MFKNNSTHTFIINIDRKEYRARLDSDKLTLFKLWSQFEYLSRNQIDRIWSLIKGGNSKYPNGNFSRGIAKGALFIPLKPASTYSKIGTVYTLSPPLIKYLIDNHILPDSTPLKTDSSINYHDYLTREIILTGIESFIYSLPTANKDTYSILESFSLFFPKQSSEFQNLDFISGEGYRYISDCRMVYSGKEFLIEFDNLTETVRVHMSKLLRYLPYVSNKELRNVLDGETSEDVHLLFVSRDNTVEHVTKKGEKISSIPFNKINKILEAPNVLVPSEVTNHEKLSDIFEKLDHFDYYALPFKGAGDTIGELLIEAYEQKLCDAINLDEQEYLLKYEEIKETSEKALISITEQRSLNSDEFLYRKLAEYFNTPDNMRVKLISYDSDSYIPKRWFHIVTNERNPLHYDYLLELTPLKTGKRQYIGLM